MTKPTLARTLRAVIVLVLLFVIAVILWYFLSHRRPHTIIPPRQGQIPAEKVERQEGIEHFDYKGDRVVRAKAARHYAGEDGRYYLDGNVEIRDLSREEGEEVVLFGQRVSYDKDWTEILLEGEAKLQYEGLTVESSMFSYQKKKELLTSDQGVTFFSKGISGTAQDMAYTFRYGSLRLEGGVELEIREEEETRPPLVVRGDLVTFVRKRRRGEVERNTSFSFGQSRGSADSLRFDLTPDEQHVRGFFLRGNAHAVLVESRGPSGEESSPAAQEREIWADSIDIRTHKDSNWIQKVEARDRCALKFSTPEGQTTEVHSDQMMFIFDRRGVSNRILVSGAAHLVERSPASEVERTMSGEEIYIGTRGRNWEIKAPEGGEARVDSSDSDVTARFLAISTTREILQATGDVKAIIKLRGEEGETVGFFSNKQPVFGTAEKMRFEKKLDRLELSESVRMWQGSEVLFAGQVTVLKKTGEITAEGKVRTVLTRPPRGEDEAEERVEVGGEKMSFNPSENLLTFDQSSWFKSKGVGLKSERIAVFLLEKTAEVKQIVAEGKVGITEEIREGQGEKAIYDLGEETIVLTGKPKVTDKQKGIIEGDKLTFRLGEGRIQVENKDRERSTTVIKS
jgi:lipopolysaccharide transport protein LptA